MDGSQLRNAEHMAAPKIQPSVELRHLNQGYTSPYNDDDNSSLKGRCLQVFQLKK